MLKLANTDSTERINPLFSNEKLSMSSDFGISPPLVGTCQYNLWSLEHSPNVEDETPPTERSSPYCTSQVFFEFEVLLCGSAHSVKNKTSSAGVCAHVYPVCFSVCYLICV